MGKRSFFPRLALVNLLRNSRYYGPYLLSCGALAAMYYILRFLTWNEVIQTVRGAAYLQSMMFIGCFVVALFSTVLLLYANSFVMKRRQKELGLYNILGLEKRHIAALCIWETLLCAAAVIPGGIAAGILLSKLILLLLLKLVQIPVQFGFSVSVRGMGETAVLLRKQASPPSHSQSWTAWSPVPASSSRRTERPLSSRVTPVSPARMDRGRGERKS